ncbi:toast rack family protein [Neobacillus sp. LXY-4]|uniref:toast rack family protein n=1 Tax=Neobacillus sp. LXY-4 TaxID=3379826 RepID=UPI003EE152C8
MNKRFIVMALSAFLVVFVTAGCGIDNNNQEQSDQVLMEKDRAKELELEFTIPAGELKVSSGADEWVEGTIKYNDDKLTPDITYLHIGDKGTGVIEQKKRKLVNDGIGEVVNKWDLKVNDDVPLELKVNSGASESNLNLTGLQLRDLDVNAGIGDITIDLGGKWEESFDVSLDMGVGQSTIILPEDVGVKIKSTKGIGHAEFVDFISKGNGVYVNEAYENADVIINVKTTLGVGEAVFKLE